MVFCEVLARQSHLCNTMYPVRPLSVQVEFEVHGIVHGVFFTKYAREMCDALNIRGWIRLTKWGTAMGQIQGEKGQIDEMALWLRLQGSPGAKIDRCEFRHWQIIDGFTYRNFTVRF